MRKWLKIIGWWMLIILCAIGMAILIGFSVWYEYKKFMFYIKKLMRMIGRFLRVALFPIYIGPLLLALLIMQIGPMVISYVIHGKMRDVEGVDL